MTKVSVVITAHNNEDLIIDCIKSVTFADEVLVIDNESTDKTAKIAKELRAKVLPYKNDPDHLNESKNYGFSKAKNEWVLSLDTDERIEEDLAKEIEQVLNSNPKTNGFFIPRKNIIFGKWIQHGLWYPDHQLRLFRKGTGRFANIHNHELLEIEGKSEKLAGHILHYNYTAISQYIQKIDKQYSNNEVENFLAAKKKISAYDAIRFPLQDFLTNFFARKAYKDGLHGLVLSILQAFYMFIIFAKVWERQGFKEEKIELKETKSVFSDILRQMKFWYYKAEAEEAQGVKRLTAKIKSRMNR